MSLPRSHALCHQVSVLFSQLDSSRQRLQSTADIEAFAFAKSVVYRKAALGAAPQSISSHIRNSSFDVCLCPESCRRRFVQYLQ